MGRAQRSPSVMKAAEVAVIPHVPVILFIGGPGGGKTRHAARVANALADQGLVHICMPDVIRSALAKYKDHYSEWKTANDHYLRGELIPNHLALALVKAEMGRHPEASAFFLEGFPREARQVEDFEREVKSVNMALILDYDEKTLREHMEKRGMGMEIIDQRIKEFKQKTLPSAKYFDDQRLLHLIPGEKDDHTIFERLRDLVRKAMSTGVPILNTPSQSHSRNEVVQNDLDSIKVGASRPQSVASPQPPQSVASPQPPQSVTSPQPPYSNDTMPNGPEHTLVQPHTSTEVVNERPPTMTNHIEPPQEVHMPVAEVAAPAVAAAAVVRETTSSSRNEQNEEKPIQETLHSSQINETVVRSISPVAVNAEVAVPRSSPAHPRSESSVPNGSLTPPKTAASRTSASDNLPTGLPTNAPVLLIIGAPGAQKSDIAKRIAQKYEGFLLLSMGTLLRAKVSAESGDELWQRVARKMDQGEPVPMVSHDLLHET
ncbi:hypothetical protein Y032_0565g8 [Ancylostoma ceylanicum]|uniref:Adenylate kinase n=1 Tax=Ancylostoma ceylanicum TaxID=53326 RepID=A0A016WPR7_9BILA|nr:hypothetical protein Y032_0565g8 [Ancylostoma ceylanicum]